MSSMSSRSARSTRSATGGHARVTSSFRRGNAWVRTSHRWGTATNSGGNTPVPAVNTRFGACPTQGGTLAGVVTKWGQKAFVRYFAGTPTMTPPAKVAGSSGMHISWSFGIKVDSTADKPTLLAANNAAAQSVINGNYDAQITASVTGLDPAYFYVECLHEIDTKVNGGYLTLSLGQQMKTRFYNLVKAANPNLWVGLTIQGYALAESNTLYTGGTTDARYGGIPHDFIGLDVDGIAPKQTAPYYPDLTTRARNAQKWMRDHGAKGYAFPEWGVPANVVTADADNQILADNWITYYGNSWKAEPIPPLFAAWYDYGANPETPGSTASDQLVQPAAVAALTNLVAASFALAA